MDLRTTALYNVAGQVQEVRGHADDVAQQAVLLLVVGQAPLALLALVPRVAALAQALVGLHADAAVAAGRLALGWGRRERTRGVRRRAIGRPFCVHWASCGAMTERGWRFGSIPQNSPALTVPPQTLFKYENTQLCFGLITQHMI